MLGLFKKKDPICNMNEEKGKGVSKYGKWFCSDNCMKKYEKNMKKEKTNKKGCC